MSNSNHKRPLVETEKEDSAPKRVRVEDLVVDSTYPNNYVHGWIDEYCFQNKQNTRGQLAQLVLAFCGSFEHPLWDPIAGRQLCYNPDHPVSVMNLAEGLTDRVSRYHVIDLHLPSQTLQDFLDEVVKRKLKMYIQGCYDATCKCKEEFKTCASGLYIGQMFGRTFVPDREVPLKLLLYLDPSKKFVVLGDTVPHSVVSINDDTVYRRSQIC